MTWRREARSKRVQEWIRSDPLRNAYWSKKCPDYIDDGDPCALSFHLLGVNGKVKRVSCWRHGTIATLEDL